MGGSQRTKLCLRASNGLNGSTQVGSNLLFSFPSRGDKLFRGTHEHANKSKCKNNSTIPRSSKCEEEPAFLKRKEHTRTPTKKAYI